MYSAVHVWCSCTKRTSYCKRNKLRGISQGRPCWVTVFCDVISLSPQTRRQVPGDLSKNVEMHLVKILIYHIDVFITRIYFIYLFIYYIYIQILLYISRLFGMNGYMSKYNEWITNFNP